MAELSEQDPWMAGYSQRVEDVVDSHLEQLAHEIDDIFNAADDRLEEIEIHTPLLPRPAREEVRQKNERLTNFIGHHGGVQMIVKLLEAPDIANFDKSVGQAVHNMNIAGAIEYEYMEIAEAEAAVVGLSVEDIVADAHPFLTGIVENKTEDPYRALLIFAAESENASNEEVDTDGSFLDWGLDLADGLNGEFGDYVEDVVDANLSEYQPVSEFDRFRAHILIAATTAKVASLSNQRYIGYSHEHSAMVRVVAAMSSFNKLTDPIERTKAALMLQKTFDYCHVTMARQARELLDNGPVAA